MFGSWVPLAVVGAVGSAAPEILLLDLTPLRHMNLDDGAVLRQAWDELHAASTLQGVVNRDAPRLYVKLVGDQGAIDQFWLDHMRAPGQWLAGRPVRELKNLDAALAEFRPMIKGAIVWDERVPATANLASTMAGVHDAVAIRRCDRPNSLFRRWIEDESGPRLPVLFSFVKPDGSPMFTGEGTIADTALKSSGSAKCDAYLWSIERLVKTGKVDPSRLGYYPDAYYLRNRRGIGIERTLLSNHDWIVAHRGLVFDLGPWDDAPVDDCPNQPIGTDGRTFRELLRVAQARSPIPIHIAGFTPWDQKYTQFTGIPKGEVATEWRTVEIATCFDAFLDADAAGLHAMANASFFQHFPLKDRYPQPNIPTVETLRRKGMIGAQRPFVAFYVGDYDSAAWVYQMLPTLWNDPQRGQIPLGWAFNPVLERRFPVGLDYFRQTASPMDTFVAGDSGAGYVNPGYLEPPRHWSGLASGLDKWIAFSRPFFERWDIRMTGFVIDGNAPEMNDRVRAAYAELNPYGVVAQKTPEMSLVNGVPFLRMGADLPVELEDAAQHIAREAPRGQAWFRQYRTVLWSPTKHRQLMDRVRELRPDIEFVDPHALMLMAREHLKAQARP